MEADKTASQHGGKVSGSNMNNNGMGFGMPGFGYGGMGGMMPAQGSESFFGGNFFIKDGSDEAAKMREFLPKTPGMTGQAIMAELSSFAGMDKQKLLAEIDNELHVDEGMVVKAI